jgi:hypothetical protein
MTDFRTLCAELADNLERYQCWYIEDNGYGIPDLEALLRRASTALAQPEPQRPTDEELEELADVMNVPGDPVPAMRRALELWGVPMTDRTLSPAALEALPE